MAILGHFWPNLDILWAQPGQNGEKIDFFENTKNVRNYPQNPSKNSLELFRMVLGVKKGQKIKKPLWEYHIFNMHFLNRPPCWAAFTPYARSGRKQLLDQGRTPLPPYARTRKNKSKFFTIFRIFPPLHPGGKSGRTPLPPLHPDQA